MGEDPGSKYLRSDLRLKMLMSNIRDEIVGRFRKDDEYVRVGSHIALAPKEINGSLEKCFPNTMPQVTKISSTALHDAICIDCFN